ncbi:MAG: uridine kinase [Candidatus Hydrogenedentes bacterium]|nr:uridine kinase [Candidatus Hydrogenedentota bacterium]MBI3119306.1 uridine kinase [Candidatus Hydrogenedentota bacterium]
MESENRTWSGAIIGIGGGTGAGKSTLAQAIAALRPGGVSLIECDWYYRDQGHLSLAQREQTNYDHPDALEIELLAEQLTRLRAGEAVDAPVYDFSEHTRCRSVQRIEARPLIVLEGLHVLVNARLRALLALKVYVHCPPNLRLSRRIQRDTAERGRELNKVLAQYERDVEPMHSRYVEQSRVHADIEVSGLDDPEASAARILSSRALAERAT